MVKMEKWKEMKSNKNKKDKRQKFSDQGSAKYIGMYIN